ncbi:MAG: ankyrin repeat domain-containing protein, partial [Candidatus Omnitrophica bacterium]|nr:ankyrin repeat domain-containing protein [Candidatus Omnitrophota bacterium]
MVEELLSSGAKVNYVSLDGNNAIKSAAKAQHKEIVELLLNQKKLPNKKRIKEALNKGLSAAISKDPVDLDMVRFFIEKGAAPDAKDIYLAKRNSNSADLLPIIIPRALDENKKKRRSILIKEALYLLGPGALVSLILASPALLTYMAGEKALVAIAGAILVSM